MCYWYVPNGVHLPTWFPKQEGTLVELPETLEPLSFAREYLNCFHGLTHNTAHTNGDTEGCGHGQGSASFLTGAQALKTQDAVRVDISADQLYGPTLVIRRGFLPWSSAANPLDPATRLVTAGHIRRTFLAHADVSRPLRVESQASL